MAIELELALAVGRDFVRRARFLGPIPSISVGPSPGCVLRYEIPGIERCLNLLRIERERAVLRFERNLRVEVLKGKTVVATEDLIQNGSAQMVESHWELPIVDGAQVVVRFGDGCKLLIKTVRSTQTDTPEILVAPGSAARCGTCSTEVKWAVVGHGALSPCPKCTQLMRFVAGVPQEPEPAPKKPMPPRIAPESNVDTLLGFAALPPAPAAMLTQLLVAATGQEHRAEISDLPPEFTAEPEQTSGELPVLRNPQSTAPVSLVNTQPQLGREPGFFGSDDDDDFDDPFLSSDQVRAVIAPADDAEYEPDPLPPVPVEVAPAEVAPVQVAPVQVAPVEVAPVEVVINILPTPGPERHQQSQTRPPSGVRSPPPPPPPPADDDGSVLTGMSTLQKRAPPPPPASDDGPALKATPSGPVLIAGDRKSGQKVATKVESARIARLQAAEEPALPGFLSKSDGTDEFMAYAQPATWLSTSQENEPTQPTEPAQSFDPTQPSEPARSFEPAGSVFEDRQNEPLLAPAQPGAVRSGYPPMVLVIVAIAAALAGAVLVKVFS